MLANRRRSLIQGHACASILLLALCGPSIANGQELTKPALPEDVIHASQDYAIGPGDILDIEITGVFSDKVRVSNSGKIHILILGVVRVAGMTTAQLQDAIARLLIERELVKAPWVTVSVTEYLSQPVYVLGEVELPGQFALRGDTYLVDLIAWSNGFSENASPVVYLYRRKLDPSALSPNEPETDEAIKIDLHALNEGRNPEQNYRLRGGDVLYVPSAAESHVFLIGDVHTPGRYSLGRDGMPATRVIVANGGPLKTARLKKAMLIRMEEDGTRSEIPLDLDAIFRGRKADVEVRTGDIIFVPGSTTKSFAYAMSAILPGTIVRRIPLP